MMPYSHTICVEGSQIDHRHRELYYNSLGIQYRTSYILTPPRLLFFITYLRTAVFIIEQVIAHIYGFYFNLRVFSSATIGAAAFNSDLVFTPPELRTWYIEIEMKCLSTKFIHSWHNLNCFTSSTYICVVQMTDCFIL